MQIFTGTFLTEDFIFNETEMSILFENGRKCNNHRLTFILLRLKINKLDETNNFRVKLAGTGNQLIANKNKKASVPNSHYYSSL